MINKKYSITSNEVKLFKHLDNLKSIQQGKAVPIMFHIAPTCICNLKCPHCCFATRDKGLSIDFDILKDALYQMWSIGVRAIEWNGGGDPTLYERIEDTVVLANAIGFKQGFITNAVDIKGLKSWDKLSWVRVSLNALDTIKGQQIQKYEDNIEDIKSKTKVTGCYIVSRHTKDDILTQVIATTDNHKIITRIAPDLIEDTTSNIEYIKSKLPLFNDYTFFSDFNLFAGERNDNICAMHLIKPFLFADGYVYRCPSSELAKENNKTAGIKFRVCKSSEIKDYYTNKFEIFRDGCSYCKYTMQNNLLWSLLEDTDNNEFA